MTSSKGRIAGMKQPMVSVNRYGSVWRIGATEVIPLEVAAIAIEHSVSGTLIVSVSKT